MIVVPPFAPRQNAEATASCGCCRQGCRKTANEQMEKGVYPGHRLLDDKKPNHPPHRKPSTRPLTPRPNRRDRRGHYQTEHDPRVIEAVDPEPNLAAANRSGHVMTRVSG